MPDVLVLVVYPGQSLPDGELGEAQLVAFLACSLYHSSSFFAPVVRGSRMLHSAAGCLYIKCCIVQAHGAVSEQCHAVREHADI